MSKHFIIPDCQVKPGVDFSYLTRIGKYIVEKQPDVIVCIGDFADMPSLSSYDVGTKSFEGRRYVKDIEATKDAMGAFMSPMLTYNVRQKANGKKQYKPRLVFTLGNHEHRISRAINLDSKLDGVLSLDDLEYDSWGWEVFPFLEVVVIDGVAYSHYFTSGQLGRPVTSASACLAKKHMSTVQGHQQGLQIATGYAADGRMLQSIIAGSCYEHAEEYLNPQTNNHWRGCLMLHDVRDGEFDIMPVSLKYLNNREYK